MSKHKLLSEVIPKGDHIVYGEVFEKVEGMGGGTSNYELLNNLPKINGYTLIGNKTSAQLDLLGIEHNEDENAHPNLLNINEF